MLSYPLWLDGLPPSLHTQRQQNPSNGVACFRQPPNKQNAHPASPLTPFKSPHHQAEVGSSCRRATAGNSTSGVASTSPYLYPPPPPSSAAPPSLETSRPWLDSVVVPVPCRASSLGDAGVLLLWLLLLWMM